MEVDTELNTGRVLGRGLNSLRVRFTSIVGVFASSSRGWCSIFWNPRVKSRTH